MKDWGNILLVVGGGLLMISAASYAAQKRGDGPTTPALPIRIVVLGDSLVAGNVFCRTLRNLLPPGSEVQCLGEENIGVSQVKEQAQGYLAGSDYVVVLAGVNDLASGRGVVHVVNGLAQLYTMAHAVGARAIGVSLTPWRGNPKGSDLQVETQAINEWILGPSNSDLEVDTSVLGSSSGFLSQDYAAPDGLHLNSSGQVALAELIAARLL